MLNREIKFSGPAGPPSPKGQPSTHGGKLPAMQNHEITTKLTPPNLFERLAGIGVAYLTTISDGARQVTGQGPTPQDAHEAAQSEWELAHQPNSAMMFP